MIVQMGLIPITNKYKREAGLMPRFAFNIISGEEFYSFEVKIKLFFDGILHAVVGMNATGANIVQFAFQQTAAQRANVVNK